MQDEGRWIDFDKESGVSFKLAYYGNDAFQAKLRRVAFQSRRNNRNRALNASGEKQASITAIIGTVLLDWKGLDNGFDDKGNGIPYPFTPENAEKLLTESKEIFDFVSFEAAQLQNFQEEETGGLPEGEGASAELKSGAEVDA